MNKNNTFLYTEPNPVPSAENLLNKALKKGYTIFLINSNNEPIKLEDGFKLISYQLITLE